MKIYAILLLVFSPLSFGNEPLDSLISLDIKFAEPKRFNSHVDNFEASLWPKFEPEK